MYLSAAVRSTPSSLASSLRLGDAARGRRIRRTVREPTPKVRVLGFTVSDILLRWAGRTSHRSEVAGDADEAKISLASTPRSTRRESRLIVLLVSPIVAIRVLLLLLLSNGSQGVAWIAFAVGVPLVMLWWYVRIRRGWTGIYWNPFSWWAGGRVADSMTQWPIKPARPPAPVGPLQAPMTRAGAGPLVNADGSLVRDGSATFYETHPPPLDWHGIVGSISVRLEEALGEGFSIEPAGYSPALRYGDVVQIVPLTGALETPPLDEGTRAVRACRKMMHETQQFAERVLGHSWPDGPEAGTSLDSIPNSRGAAGSGHAERVEI
jgi:hypothetical protein